MPTKLALIDDHRATKRNTQKTPINYRVIDTTTIQLSGVYYLYRGNTRRLATVHTHTINIIASASEERCARV